MSILIPVYDTGVTLTEVPDRVSFYVEFGECTQHCEGCHSPHLWNPVTPKMDLSDLKELAEDAVAKGANAIVLMGGTTNNIGMFKLINIINTLAKVAPVCLYSGSDDEARNDFITRNSNLTWVKTGSYKANLGGLSSDTTNQKFYRKVYVDYPNGDKLLTLLDETYRFRI